MANSLQFISMATRVNHSGFFKIHFRPIGPIDLNDLKVTLLTCWCWLSNYPKYQFRHHHKLYCSKSENLDDMNRHLHINEFPHCQSIKYSSDPIIDAEITIRWIGSIGLKVILRKPDLILWSVGTKFPFEQDKIRPLMPLPLMKL